MNSKLFGFLVIATWACFGVTTMAQSPLQEHEMLKMDEGVWNANLTMWSGPDTEPTKSILKETGTMVGELWSLGKVEGKISGVDYVGYATLGYDPMLKKYVGTYVDSITPAITHMLGTYDAKTKTLTLFFSVFGEGGQEQERKNIMVYKDKNTRDFTTYIKNGEEWTKSTTILYKRIE